MPQKAAKPGILFLYAVVGLALWSSASAIVNFVFNRLQLGRKYEKSISINYDMCGITDLSLPCGQCFCSGQRN